MLGGCWSYLRHQLLPRWFPVLSGAEFWIAVALAVAFALRGERVGLAAAKIGEVATAALAYSAVAFGFSLAGLTLALTLPDEAFAQELATTGRRAPRGRIARLIASWHPSTENAYSELLFIFSWTAVAHWFAVVASFSFLIEYGFDETLLAPHTSSLHRAAVGVWAFVGIYAVSLFLLTLITLSQVGRIYIGRLRQRS